MHGWAFLVGPTVWISFEKDGGLKPEEPALIVAVSTSMPQYKALYSQARELGEYLLRKMEFQKIATVRSSAFPPEVLVRDDGTSSLPECSFYLSKGKKDVLLFAGDTSPMEDQYAFAGALLRKAEEFGAKELYSVGARWAENPLPPDAEPETSGFSTDKAGVAKLTKHGVKIHSEEPAPFFASMVVAMAKDHGIRGYKLSVDHGEPSPHTRSVAKLLDALSKLAGFDVDLGDLKVPPGTGPARQPRNPTIYQ
jgi:proteasome assembly chaperone (PAC2) family protein